MLVVHHLGRSQSDRILWFCEELGIPYEMKKYNRTEGGGAPPEYKALSPFGTAPTITDGKVSLGETGAVMEYISQKHAGGKLMPDPSASNYAEHLFWFHFGNATFVPAGMMALKFPGEPAGPTDQMRRGRWERCYQLVEERLGEAQYFAGPDLTSADIMMSYPLFRMRKTIPYDLANAPNTLAYLKRIGARPAFQRAMQKGDPDMPPMLT